MIYVKLWSGGYKCTGEKREKKSILCRIEWVAETHRKKNIYLCILRTSLWGVVVPNKWPAWDKKRKKRGPERPEYSRNSWNPSGRIMLKDDQNILPAAEMPELTIRTGECSHQSYSAFRRTVLFFHSKRIVIVVVVVVFLHLLLRQTVPWQN